MKNKLKQIWVDDSFHKLLKEQALINNTTIKDLTKELGKKKKLDVDNFEDIKLKPVRFNL